MRAVSNVDAGRIWPASCRFPASVLVEQVLPCHALTHSEEVEIGFF